MTRERLLKSLISVNTRNADIEAAVERLFKIYGSFNAIAEAESDDIAAGCGINKTSAEIVSMIPDIARYIYRERTSGVSDLSNCLKAGEYLRMTYLGQHNEMMYVLALDADGWLIKRELVQEGTVDETSIYMRKIMECAFTTNASVLVMSHNHPGGTPEMSMADHQCTAHLANLSSEYGIALADHIIIADGKAHSMARMGEMPRQKAAFSEKVRRLLDGWIPADGADDE